MQLIYVTDLHGDQHKYEKVLELAIKQDIKLIVNGGDLLPKQCDRHTEQPIFITKYLSWLQRSSCTGKILCTPTTTKPGSRYLKYV